MSESLNVAKAKNYEARPKAGRATVSAEAGRQSGTPNPCWLRHRDAEPQALTRNEARRSIVKATRSDAVSRGAEPLYLRRRQHLSSLLAELIEPFGVAGRASCEGCSREGGMSVTVLNDWKRLDNWLQRVSTNPTWSRQGTPIIEVRGTISATRERGPNAVSEVGGDDSSEEVPAMGMDAKRPHFDGVTGAVTGSPSRRMA